MEQTDNYLLSLNQFKKGSFNTWGIYMAEGKLNLYSLHPGKSQFGKDGSANAI